MQSRHRRTFGRFTRNFVVQGTGAEWAACWIAELRNRLWQMGGSAGGPMGGDGAFMERPHLVFFLHDEVVVHTPLALADDVAAAANEAAGVAAGLLFRTIGIDFPLTISTVRSYADAGKAGVASPPDRGCSQPRNH